MNDFARTIRLSTKKTFLAKNIDEGNIIPSDIGTFNDYDNTETYQVTIDAGGGVTKDFEEAFFIFSGWG